MKMGKNNTINAEESSVGYISLSSQSGDYKYEMTIYPTTAQDPVPRITIAKYDVANAGERKYSFTAEADEICEALTTVSQLVIKLDEIDRLEESVANVLRRIRQLVQTAEANLPEDPATIETDD